MPYLMGGFPTLAESLRVGRGLRRRGRGPDRARRPLLGPARGRPRDPGRGHARAGGRRHARGVLREVATPLGARIPVVLMCYSNPLLHRGVRGVRLARSPRPGVAGLIVPDLPAEEARRAARRCATRRGVALVPLVAPTTPPEQVREIAAPARGFVYVVSVTGVTGERGQLPPELAEVVGRVRSATELPVAVGFGIGTPEQAAAVGEIADGVIIGSRLVRTVAEAADIETGLDEVRGFLGEVSAALSIP